MRCHIECLSSAYACALGLDGFLPVPVCGLRLLEDVDQMYPLDLLVVLIAMSLWLAMLTVLMTFPELLMMVIISVAGILAGCEP